MSRSYKKDVWKVRGHMYGLHNRTMRRINKQRVNQGLRPISHREKINDWDIVDWRLYNVLGRRTK